MEVDLLQLATHPATIGGGGASMAVVYFLANKVWRGHRHEVSNMKQSIENNGKSVEKLFEKLEEHAQRDTDQFREISNKMSDNHAELLRVLGTKADRR